MPIFDTASGMGILLNLLGDSQIIRLSEAWRNSRISTATNIQVTEVIAESGCSISRLKALIKSRRPRLEGATLIFIATNDISQDRDLEQMKGDYLALLRIVPKFMSSNGKLFITQIPSFPKYKHEQQRINKIDGLNIFLSTLTSSKVSVIRWEFAEPLSAYFESTIGARRRPDLIHLNNKGFQLLGNAISVALSPG